VVNPAIVERAAEVYRAVGVKEEDLRFQKFLDQPSPDTRAGHSWVTDDCCQPCEVNQAPFINDCDYDQAGAILGHIYGDLRPKAENLSGTFIEFLQAEFAPGGKAAVNGLHDRGLVYVPKACAQGAACFLHVVLHGCEQSTEVLGSIGANEWADTNGIVVLYPQARSVDRTALDSAFPDRIFRNAFAVNPNGCWNWWGYAYDERFALKDGAQIGAIHGMIKRIMGTDAE
jgi:poly(3-hydroxybutyrate) depolymerase